MKNNTYSLKEEIKALEDKQTNDLSIIKEDLQSIYNCFRPTNLLKVAYDEVSSSPELKNLIYSKVLAVGSGLLIKKLLVGESKTTFRELTGTLLQVITSTVISRHSIAIKSSIDHIRRQYLGFSEKV